MPHNSLLKYFLLTIIISSCYLFYTQRKMPWVFPKNYISRIGRKRGWTSIHHKGICTPYAGSRDTLPEYFTVQINEDYLSVNIINLPPPHFIMFNGTYRYKSSDTIAKIISLVSDEKILTYYYSADSMTISYHGLQRRGDTLWLTHTL